VQKLLDVLPLNDERRRFQRVRVNLLGRYMLADRREFPCQVVDMSPGDIAVEAPVTGEPGQRIVAYIDHLGRIEGTITRVSPTGFAMSISATARKRDKLAAQLTWLANRHILEPPDDRQQERKVSRNPRSVVTMPNGTSVTCQIVDLSLSGAAVETATVPPIGALVTLGKTPGRVVRHVEGGFAVEFTRLQHPDFLEENVASP
jgi:PilZ domain-containing protein